MRDRRLYYRVVLKSMLFIGVLVLLFVFLNSLFVASKTEVVKEKALVSLDISDMQRGEIRKTRLDHKEVAVLYRKQVIGSEINNLHKTSPGIYSSESRSRKVDYFVYYNHGDSGNCPLFYSDEIFKDVCSGKLFDDSGREKNNKQHGYKIAIPPHYFIENQIYFGSWDNRAIN